MKKIMTVALSLVCLMSALSAQEKGMYEKKYDLLVSKFGPAGVGIETLLDNWEKEDSTNIRLLYARFDYLFTKAQSSRVVTKAEKKYLGMDPVLSLKDSTGNDVYYYQESVFDDVLYGQALKAADKAIEFWPDRLDFRFLKVNAYIAYEKESPDMALASLIALLEENVQRQKPWIYNEAEAEKDFLADAMQEYCRSFYTLGTEAAMSVFYNLSKRLYELYPSKVCFLSNMATYNLVAKNDPKTALKLYNKVLKKVKNDETALRNSYVAASKLGNDKLKEKYRQQLVHYGYIKQ